MVAWARDEILKLLQPFMPFITEELWATVSRDPGRRGREPGIRNSMGRAGALDFGRAVPECRNTLLASLIGRRSGLADDKAEAEIGWVIDLVTAIRSVRAEMNITAAIPLVLAGASAETKARAERWGGVHQAAGARV